MKGRRVSVRYLCDVLSGGEEDGRHDVAGVGIEPAHRPGHGRPHLSSGERDKGERRAILEGEKRAWRAQQAAG